MILEQIQGLLYLISGFSFFIVMSLVFRLVSLNRGEGKRAQLREENDLWPGLEELEILDILQETSDIKTFRLKRKKEREMPSYNPGQFLSFQIGDDSKLLRSYSISSSCENRKVIEVSIKKIKDGVGSGWFHSLSVGDNVLAHSPAGLFTDGPLNDEPRVFIAGGIGITPFMSMIISALDRGEKHEVVLFYGARGASDLAFHDTLLILSKRYENFHYYPVLSDEEVSTYLHGRITLDLIKSKVSSMSKSKFFFCGPPPMTDGLSKDLKNDGIAAKDIHSEKFISPTTVSLSDIPDRNLVVQYNKKKYDYSGKKNLLEFFEDQDVDIPFACRSGVCGACKVKCISGKALSLSNSGLSEEEQESHILTCVSWPEEELVLE